MKKKFNFIIILIISVFTFVTMLPLPVQARENVTLLFFWSEGCPHCAMENQYLDQIKQNYPELTINKFEVSKNKENQEYLEKLSKEMNFNASGVPITVVGDKHLIGYTRGLTDQKIISLIQDAQTSLSNEEICKIDEPCEEDEKKSANKTINLPLLGQIETKNFSLPVLSVILGSLDGFNPCAMWTLLFLISLLLGMEDKRRMWILGTTFIVASASVYFIFMSAWLNLLLFIGLIASVRILIGLIALGGGAYNVRDFLINKDGGCRVSGDEKRQAVFERIKKTVYKKSFILSILGIIALAFAVNLVELICSAGLPAVFTQILTMSDLSRWQYYLYILLYIFFFMIDDLFIFIITMITFRLTGITTKYSRFSRLVGGILMLAIGVILIIKPEWLMFG